MAAPLPPDLVVDPSAPPDVMNDPQYAPRPGGGEDGTGDPDTCRICRGEGSDAEPLFHPCKCSGSIKHVHQDCLMEWLSHSQKKYCELCKTPFRFTKLYSPNMPQHLPTGVFFRRSVVHSMRHLGTWLRFCLVLTVWLGCLPYVIRQVWRLLFWFSDGGWPPRYMDIDAVRNASQIWELALEHAQYLTENGTTPATPFHAAPTTPASEGSIWTLLMRFSETMNISESDPLLAGLFKSLYYGLGIPVQHIPPDQASNASVPSAIIGSPVAPQSSSLLSTTPYLSNMTRNPYVNRLIVTVAEGYIITLLVVISFILIFLIREWVVQQQFGANLRAGFNQDVAAERPRERDPPAPEEPAPVNVPEARDVGQRPMARPRRRNIQFEDPEVGAPRRAAPRDALPAPENAEGSRQQRPAPIRDALTPASEIQRQLTEEPRMAEEFLAIWRRADGDPQEVLRIIEEENKADEMRYWVNAMKTLQPHLPQDDQQRPRVGPGEASTTINGAGSRTDRIKLSEPKPESSGGDGAGAKEGSDHGSTSSDSWEDIPGSTYNPAEESVTANTHEPISTPRPHNYDLSSGKGKEREAHGGECQPISHQPENRWNAPIQPIQFESSGSSISRPRAVSDGPKLKDNISPLANNNWSFKNLPDTENRDKSHPPFPPPFENAKLAPNFQSFSYSTRPDANGSIPTDPPEGSDVWRAELRPSKAIEESREHELTPKVLAPPQMEPEPYGPVTIRHQDGTERTYANWDEVFDANPLSGPGEDSDHDEHVPEPPFRQDTPPADPPEQAVARPAEPQGILENVADWLWGGVDDRRPDEDANGEHNDDDLAADPRFAAGDGNPFEQGDFAEQDREVAEAAIAVGIDPNDPDAIDEAEDFDGIMELIGMRGPLFSLAQNALFSAFLLALTVAFGVWIPYNIGRVTLLLAANPGPAFKLPLRLVFWWAAFLQDLAATILGFVSYCFIFILLLPVRLWNAVIPGTLSLDEGFGWANTALRVSNDAVDRILHGTVDSLLNFKDSDIFTFSAASHESLLTLGSLVKSGLASIGQVLAYPFIGGFSLTLSGIWNFLVSILQGAWQLIWAVPRFLMKPDSWVISLEVSKRATPLNPELSAWNGVDRFWATLAGYTTLCTLGALYVKKGTPFSTGPVGREWEATVIDILHQAGGVLKVILIISIEMLVFPLYCGLLLDAALLPLFDNATIMSRVQFTLSSPLTSVFVHWFVGTCYMFHFALFVSMCRKIMRKGVLYFIRDPDDPTFHPVRDVLERNVSTQLRKILFSALVYGALVVICLGGVVWGISLAFRGVLPIHWSSNEPVLEFPIDLLFYNFLMPLAVKVFKPSDGLHAMYNWWFHTCARMLRLSWFLFDERRVEEEGYNVRRTWNDVFRGLKGDPMKVVRTSDPRQPFINDPEMDVYFRRDGRYVRAPASDQVRIPKGSDIFLQVDENNNRVDGKWDRPDGVHGRESRLYKQVYVPPHFRLRICAFILSIWIFAALTGVSITIVPLVFGRHIFSKLLPSHIRKNDVYAFSIGIYILGSVLYGVLHLRSFITSLISSLALTRETPQNVLRRVVSVASGVSRIVWTYAAFIFILPTLFAFVVEFYAILPLHTYFSSSNEPHTIHFVQSWTLGLLYVKLTSRVILLYPDSLPAISMRAITRDGYLNPDAKLATRAFILPGSIVLCFALLWPYAVAQLAVLTVFNGIGEEQKVLVYRYVYPVVLGMGICCWLGWLMVGMLRVWRNRIRDEVYLIGERLHNFGERKTTGNGVVIGVRRIET